MLPSRRPPIPARSWNRREFVLVSGASVAWPFLAGPARAIERRNIQLGGDPFTLGVASGDPTPEGFVIWTRLAPRPLEGGGMPGENVEVAWEVAHDEQMQRVAARGTAIASPELAHSVHVEVPGLDADRWYFYRFTAAGEASPVGRARTAPPPGLMPARLRLAVASCQHFEYGYYTSYEHMVGEDLDLVLHLGDYIYEYEGNPKRVRKHVGPECKTLDQYRTRYAQYRADKYLQAAHAACPWVVTWDDHEFDNNCAGAISEEARVDTETFLKRRAQAYQAYYEHMPLRRTQFPRGPHCELYRRVDFGRLVEFAVLDTRQYRSDQPCGDHNKPPCDAVYDPRNTLLGEVQEQWLYAGLRASAAAWNVLAQQVMMGRVDRMPGPTPAYSMDQWPGYEANRQRVLKFFRDEKPSNPIVLAGDIHSHWANNLQVDSADPRSPVVASEFVGTSISSGGDGHAQGLETPLMLAENPFVKFYNGQRGYLACEVTPKTWTTCYRGVEYVTRPGAKRLDLKAFVVESGRPGLQAG